MTSDWRSFQLIPEDVLFFRDGKPASMGQDHYLRSLFPPSPSTLYGAIRTRRLLDEGVELSSLNESKWGALDVKVRGELGEWGAFGTLRLRGPWIVREHGDERDVLLPAPADLGLVMRSDPQTPGNNRMEGPAHEHIECVVRYLLEDSGQGKRWSHPLGLASPYVRPNGSRQCWKRFEAGPEPRPVASWFLTSRGIEAWMGGEVPCREDFVHAKELWLSEVRTGLGLEPDRRSSSNGMLYTFGYVRLHKGVSLEFELRGSELGAVGWLRLGGDGRPVRLQPGSPSPLPPVREETHRDRQFLLAFLTPTLSETGAYLPGFSADRLSASLAGLQATLVGGLVRSPLLVGGWDLANARAKPLRRAIPAGSVFAFETEADSKAICSLHCSNLSDFESERLAQQGFGLTIVGEMPRKDA